MHVGIGSTDNPDDARQTSLDDVVAITAIRAGAADGHVAADWAG